MSNPVALWQAVPWDTQFFGIKTARITVGKVNSKSLSAILNEIAAWGAQVIHFLADVDDDLTIKLIEDANFHLVDIRITLICNLQRLTLPETTSTISLQPFQDADVPELQHIASNSYNQTRYYYDSHYSQEHCSVLYKTWIINSCQDSFQRVLVAKQAGHVSGFITYQLADAGQISKIGLVGVHESKRGLGIGRLLVQAAQRDLYKQGISTLQVVTQGRNIDAQCLYQRCDFLTEHVGLWYHKWL